MHTTRKSLHLSWGVLFEILTTQMLRKARTVIIDSGLGDQCIAMDDREICCDVATDNAHPTWRPSGGATTVVTEIDTRCAYELSFPLPQFVDVREYDDTHGYIVLVLY